MKKVLLLPLLAVTALVSYSWAANCPNGGDLKYCMYKSGDCWPAAGESAACGGGWFFCGQKDPMEGKGTFCSGGTFLENGSGTSGSPPSSPLPIAGCCKWNTGECWTQYGDVGDCKDNNTLLTPGVACTSDDGTCPGGGGGGGGGGDGQSPILQINPNMGLIVATHGRALHISSDRNATVTLYTLGGQKVLSGTVSAGNKVFSLMSQNPGVYYAVVQSGSYTQTVSVVLK